MKVIFAGTPEFAVNYLKALLQSKHKVCAVLTQQDKPAGRGLKIKESPIKTLALQYHLSVYQPRTLKDQSIQDTLKSLNADAMIDVAFGLLVPKEILNMFPYGCINVHPSLLPKWRGASPIQYAILSGDPETGVSIMQMDEGLDTGPIFLQEKFEIDENETTGDLEKQLSKLGVKLLLQTLDQLETGNIQAKKQDDSQSCYAKKIQKLDAKIDWQKSAAQIHREIRAFNPWPVSYAQIGDQTVRIYQAVPLNETSDEKPGKIIRTHKEGIDIATGQNVLRVQTLQFPGGKPLNAAAILNSKKDFFKKHGYFMAHNTPPFILVDGSSYLHRAYHALPPLTTLEGQPTGAVYGVANMLRRLIKDYQPKHMAIVFDAKGKNFRHELYADYKANRPSMPDDLKSQIEPLHKIIKALGLPILMVEGVEADDVIGTLAKKATDLNLDTLIATSDKDFAQLVNEHVTLIDTMTNTKLDIAGVKKKFGILPERIIDYLTLVGDTSDNIPGVPKVGPKTAAKILNEYGSLDQIIEQIPDIKGQLGENLRKSLEQMELSKQLVTIKTDVDLAENPLELIDQPDNTEELIELCTQLEFKSWLKELLEKNNPTISTHNGYQIILQEEVFDHLLNNLDKASLFAVDTETTSLNYMQAELVGLSFAIKPEKAVYLPLAHDYPGAPQQLDLKKVLKKLKPILENKKIEKVGHNVKYDKEVLANYNIDLGGIAYDTMLESYVLNSTATRHNLDTLALTHLKIKKISYEELAGKGTKQIPFNEVPIEQAGQYSSEDADTTLKLHHHLWPEIKKDKKLNYVFSEIEMPLLSVLSKMERHGVLVDADHLHQQSQILKRRIHKIEQEAFKLADSEFNLDSPKQLQEILYKNMGLPVLKKTPTGQASTAEAVLEELALNFPLPKLILEYRSLSKLKSTYTDQLPKQINPNTHRIHTSYHQAVTATGRLSSSDPNLQNIPARTDEGRQIRQAFIAPRGYRLLSADYSQIELRLVAHISQDKGLIADFQKDLDIHKATASKILDIPLEKVTDIQRRKAKTINFGLMYGMSAFGLAKRLGIDRHDAKAYIDSYFEKYPAIQEYMEETKKFARKNGYVETLFGRRLYTPDIRSRNKQRQNAAERAAINGPLQGTAADIIKIAMIKIDEWLEKSKLDVHLIMQVHDELIFEVATKDLDQAQQKIQQLMSKVAELSIPLTVDIGIGKNWDEAH
jgi:DNA polymerase-1